MNYSFVGKLANGDSRYKISFNVYRDCDDGVPLDDKITLGVYLNDPNTSQNQKPSFNRILLRRVEAPGSVDCPDIRANVCIEYGLYEGIITLKPYSEGYHITYTRCCRNVQNNITQSGTQPSQGQTYYCFIPNTDLENNSPAFYGVPSPYMCANDTTSFLFDAVDQDGDSLSYHIMRPFNSGGTGALIPEPSITLDTPLLAYKPGFSFQQPFGATGHTFIDGQTGYTELFSAQTGRYVVGVEVREFRNGILISRTRLDLSIIVLDCAINKTPDLEIDKENRLRVEAGVEICFNVTASDISDPNGDIVRLSGRGALLGDAGGISGTQATFRDTAGQPIVTSEFCWTPDCDAARPQPYFVYFSVEDGGCPPKFNNLDVIIHVDSFEGAKILTGPDNVCAGDVHVYTVSDGGSSSAYEWEVTQGTIQGVTNEDEVSILWDGTGVAKVRVREVNAGGCIGEWIDIDVTLVESHPSPVITGKDTVCQNEVGLLYTVGTTVGASYYWNTVNATIDTENDNQIRLGAYGQPTFIVQAAVTNAVGCISDTVEKEVFVSIPNPTLTGPMVVCPNSKNIKYIAAGASTSIFVWSVVGGTMTSGGNTNTSTVDWGDEGFGTVEVEETDKFGCVSVPFVLNVNKTYVLAVDSIVGPFEVCEFDLGVGYSVVESNGSVYDWTIAGGNQSSGDSSATIAIDWSVAGGADVTVVQRAFDGVNSRNCVSPPYTLAVTIFPKPIADQIRGPIEVCQISDSFEYTVLGLANSIYRWAINGNDQDILGQGTNTVKIFWDQSGMFTISVQEISVKGCPGDRIDTTVVVHPKPSTSPIAGNRVICPSSYSGQVYSVTEFTTSTFLWFAEGELNAVQDGSNSITVDWDTLQNQGKLKVVEVSDEGCQGDTIYLTVEIDRLSIDLRYVSVGTPDDRMVIDWQLLNNSKVDKLFIEKREAGVGASWYPVVTVDGGITNHIETGINTDLNAFEYRVVGQDKCGVTISSEPHTSIWLSGFQDENFNSRLIFTDYLGWDNGVDFYDVLLEDNTSPYRVEIMDASANSSVVLSHNPQQYRKCFRVYAEERAGEGTNSYSNDICFFFYPEIYVPNAFTANNDGLNDGFGVKGVAINEFEIFIFNRWGEKLYTSKDIDQKWMPIYRDADVHMGTYIYVIKYTDFENKLYQKTGTINLIR
jgi:gliding motility-associated-like protein